MNKSAYPAKTLYVIVDNREYTITVQYNIRQKHIRVRINSDGQITLSAPAGTTRRKIQSVVHNKEGWLKTKIKETHLALEKNNPTERVFVDGFPFQVEFLFSDTLTPHVEVDYALQKAYVYGRENSIQSIASVVEKWLRREAKQRLPEYAKKVALEIGISYGKLFLRNQKTRWGSSSTLGNISLNWRTVMAPKAVQRYLIIHELVHQRQMNHSPQFWQQVAHFCPNYAEYESWLKENRALMGLFRATI